MTWLLICLDFNTCSRVYVFLQQTNSISQKNKVLKNRYMKNKLANLKQNLRGLQNIKNHIKENQRAKM